MPPLLNVLPSDTVDVEPPLGVIAVTVKACESSASVSSLRTSSPPPGTSRVSSSFTAPVSLTAAGVSLIPTTVIVITAMSVPPLPSLTV